MNLSISNISWGSENDDEVYSYLKEMNFKGLEIAPSKIFNENPYDKLIEANEWSSRLKEIYNLDISSIQSIWYGRNEKIFGTIEEKKILINYTKKAILFAKTIGCSNLVFGCPKNRDVENINANRFKALDFFKEIAEFACDNNVIIALEPNPTIYNTRFINTTEQAFEFIYKVNSEGLLVNIDIGTIIYNNEDFDIIENNFEYINHIHLSEPYLEVIKQNPIHIKLNSLLLNNAYNKYLSIEMSKQDLNTVKKTINYVKKNFIL